MSGNAVGFAEQTAIETGASEHGQISSARRKLLAMATGVLVSLTGCVDNQGEVAQPAAPGERVATVIFDTFPPEQRLNIYTKVIAERPVFVERKLPDRVGAKAPESINTSFKPGLATKIYSEGRLNAAPELGKVVTISCKVLLDGVETGMTDSVTVDTLNWDDEEEGFAQCVFVDFLAPQPN